MSVHDDAEKLELLFPLAMSILFQIGEEDPLRHHSLSQIKLMRCLMGGSKTAGDVGQKLGLSPSSLTQMASRLISAGLIAKELDEQDRRVRKLSLTEEGRRLMEHRRAIRTQAAAEALSRMKPERREQLIELLSDISGPKRGEIYALVEAAV